MASSKPTELISSSLKPSYVPKTTDSLLEDLKAVADPSDKLSVLNDYILQYEEELKLVKSFRGMVPQCTLFLLDSINTLKREYLKICHSMAADRLEQRAIADATGPTVMEALGIKPKESKPDQENEAKEIPENSSTKGKEPMAYNSADESCKKEKTFTETFGGNLHPINQKIIEPNISLGFIPDNEGGFKYPETLQLMFFGHQPPNPYQDIQNIYQQPSIVGSSTEGFVPHINENIRTALVNLAEGGRAPVSTPAGNNSGLNLRAIDCTLNYHPKLLTHPIWKNNRLYWTPELHERFVEVLEMLGGIREANPKEIRKAMQVEGLTTDHVKSHLQKNRWQYTDQTTGSYCERTRASGRFGGRYR